MEKKAVRYYSKGQTGRALYSFTTILQVHCMQLLYNHGDSAIEDALYEIEPMRQFAGLKLDRLPYETIIVKFRHFLAHHGLGTVLFGEVSKHLEKNGLMLREDSIVDAIIISAPSSTKNVKCERDPEMHQTKKGDQWQFSTDSTLGLIHRIDTMAANVHEIVLAGNLLHGDQQRVFDDDDYPRIQKRDEHPFRYITKVFGYGTGRYRGLAENTSRLRLVAAFSTLLIGGKYLLA